MPAATHGILPPLFAYTWETWQVPKYEERLKQSYYILQKLFKDIKGAKGRLFCP